MDNSFEEMYGEFLDKFLSGVPTISGTLVQRVLKKPTTFVTCGLNSPKVVYRAVPKKTKSAPKPFNKHKRKIVSVSHTIDGAIRGAMSMWETDDFFPNFNHTDGELFIFAIPKYEVIFPHDELLEYCSSACGCDILHTLERERELILKTPDPSEDTSKLLFTIPLQNPTLFEMWSD